MCNKNVKLLSKHIEVRFTLKYYTSHTHTHKIYSLLKKNRKRKSYNVAATKVRFRMDAFNVTQ